MIRRRSFVFGPGQLFGLLKALPMIRFALMLGGGMVATALAAHVQWWLQHGRFPEAESIWLARIQGATWMGLASTLIVGLVMITLAFGRAGRVGVKAGGIELDVDFDKPEEPEIMKRIALLVVHCSATPANRDIGVAEIRAMHTARGWRDVGYHYVIRRDGTVEKGRADSVMGAHVAGHNANSLGICLVGGVKPDMTAETNFTAEQYAALEQLLGTLTARHPEARVCGHRDLSPDRNGNGKVEPGEWVKACPTFDAGAWWTTRKGTG